MTSQSTVPAVNTPANNAQIATSTPQMGPLPNANVPLSEAANPTNPTNEAVSGSNIVHPLPAYWRGPLYTHQQPPHQQPPQHHPHMFDYSGPFSSFVHPRTGQIPPQHFLQQMPHNHMGANKDKHTLHSDWAAFLQKYPRLKECEGAITAAFAPQRWCPNQLVGEKWTEKKWNDVCGTLLAEGDKDALQTAIKKEYGPNKETVKDKEGKPKEVTASTKPVVKKDEKTEFQTVKPVKSVKSFIKNTKVPNCDCENSFKTEEKQICSTCIALIKENIKKEKDNANDDKDDDSNKEEAASNKKISGDNHPYYITNTFLARASGKITGTNLREMATRKKLVCTFCWKIGHTLYQCAKEGVSCKLCTKKGHSNGGICKTSDWSDRAYTRVTSSTFEGHYFKNADKFYLAKDELGCPYIKKEPTEEEGDE